MPGRTSAPPGLPGDPTEWDGERGLSGDRLSVGVVTERLDMSPPLFTLSLRLLAEKKKKQ